MPGDCLGDVIGDINSRSGRVVGTRNAGEGSLVEAFVPLARMLDYAPTLTNLTSGRASFTLASDHYDYASPHTAEKVIRESGFKHVEEEE